MNKDAYTFETPFSDLFINHEESNGNGSADILQPLTRYENPFARTFESFGPENVQSPFATEAVSLLSELDDPAFTRNLYELASELEDSWMPLISNESSSGDNFLPFIRQRAADYFRPLKRASEGMIDRISRKIQQNAEAGMPVTETEIFLDEYYPDTTGLTPVQEQFLGSVFKKVKSAVKAGIKAVGKVLPINILGRLKGLINPLFEKVIRFAIGKLPKYLQPYAQTLAKKLFNLESSDGVSDETVMSSTADIDAVQTELDSEIVRLVYTPDETEAEWLIREYEAGQADDGYMTAEEGNTLAAARQQFIHGLSELNEGEDPAPVIERFLPAAILALKPLIKMGISVVGRPKVISFLAGLLARLIEKHVPKNVVTPLATSIIDAGMSTIGFETADMNKPDLGYEVIANTVEDTVKNLKPLNEADINDQESLKLHLLEAFETAAAVNFPAQYIRAGLRESSQPGVWVLKPRNGPQRAYKKFTTVFNVIIDPEKAKRVLTFRDLPLASFLRDKLGIDTSKPVHARIHLYEAIAGTRLSAIGKYENLQGLNPSVKNSWIQLHPLTTMAASVLINEPGLGRDLPKKFTARRQVIATGQRFYYAEIEGARLRNGTGNSRPAHSDDVHGVINFVRSSVSIYYYFSEEQAKTIVEKLNGNDITGALMGLRSSVRGVLHQMLTGNVSNKVKIVHKAFPEMYFENYNDGQENFLGAGKKLMMTLIETLVDKLALKAYDEIRDLFRMRAAEFRQAQAEPQDGVTIGLTWNNIAGLSAVKSAISAIRNGKLVIPGALGFPDPGKPEFSIKAGKHLE